MAPPAAMTRKPADTAAVVIPTLFPLPSSPFTMPLLAPPDDADTTAATTTTMLDESVVPLDCESLLDLFLDGTWAGPGTIVFKSLKPLFVRKGAKTGKARIQTSQLLGSPSTGFHCDPVTYRSRGGKLESAHAITLKARTVAILKEKVRALHQRPGTTWAEKLESHKRSAPQGTLFSTAASTTTTTTLVKPDDRCCSTRIAFSECDTLSYTELLDRLRDGTCAPGVIKLLDPRPLFEMLPAMGGHELRRIQTASFWGSQVINPQTLSTRCELTPDGSVIIQLTTSFICEIQEKTRNLDSRPGCDWNEKIAHAKRAVAAALRANDAPQSLATFALSVPASAHSPPITTTALSQDRCEPSVSLARNHSPPLRRSTTSHIAPIHFTNTTFVAAPLSNNNNDAIAVATTNTSFGFDIGGSIAAEHTRRAPFDHEPRVFAERAAVMYPILGHTSFVPSVVSSSAAPVPESTAPQRETPRCAIASLSAPHTTPTYANVPNHFHGGGSYNPAPRLSGGRGCSDSLGQDEERMHRGLPRPNKKRSRTQAFTDADRGRYQHQHRSRETQKSPPADVQMPTILPPLRMLASPEIAEKAATAALSDRFWKISSTRGAGRAAATDSWSLGFSMPLKGRALGVCTSATGMLALCLDRSIMVADPTQEQWQATIHLDPASGSAADVGAGASAVAFAGEFLFVARPGALVSLPTFRQSKTTKMPFPPAGVGLHFAPNSSLFACYSNEIELLRYTPAGDVGSRLLLHTIPQPAKPVPGAAVISSLCHESLAAAVPFVPTDEGAPVATAPRRLSDTAAAASEELRMPVCVDLAPIGTSVFVLDKANACIWRCVRGHHTPLRLVLSERLGDPQGMTFDPRTGLLFVADRVGRRIVSVCVETPEQFRGEAPCNVRTIFSLRDHSAGQSPSKLVCIGNTIYFTSRDHCH